MIDPGSVAADPYPVKLQVYFAWVNSGRPRRANKTCDFTPHTYSFSVGEIMFKRNPPTRPSVGLDLSFVSPAVIWFAHRIPSARTLSKRRRVRPAEHSG